MTRRTDFRKAITYTGQAIKGPCIVSYKIDGVRILYRDGKYVTRNNKVPRGFATAVSELSKAQIKMHGDVEIFRDDFIKTSSTLSTAAPARDSICVGHIYALNNLDSRLYINTYDDITPDRVKDHLSRAVALGYEGLVLRTADRWYRVKPQATADVYVTGWFEQKDKAGAPKGTLGGFTTNYGNVTAFTDSTRDSLWEDPESHVGKLMVVSYKERYHTGKFRYAVRFICFRFDKDEESFDTAFTLLPHENES